MPVRPPNEDLFKDSRMSFGQHLEELRRALVRALLGVAIGCVFGFMFANQVVDLLKKPLVEAVSSYQKEKSKKQIRDRLGYLPPEYQPWFEREPMIPETLMVDPGDMIRVLRHVSPNFLAGVNLIPYTFQPDSFDRGRLPELCRQLLDPQGQSDEIKKVEVIRDGFTAAQRAEVKRIAGQATANDSDLDFMAEIFNRVIERDDLVGSPAFQDSLSSGAAGDWDLFGSGSANPLVEMKTGLENEGDSDLRRRINRVLVTQVFSSWMPPVKLDMVPMQVWRKIDAEPQSLAATETFMIWVKAGIFSGLLLASPWVLLQMWLFIAAGLYPHEKSSVYVFLPISLALFFSGAGLAFFFVFEPVLGFLFSFNASMGISPQIRINEWLGFVMFLPIGFGVAFQLPLVMLFLNRINLFTIETYLNKWRIAVMVIFALSMLLTPADPISMIMLGIPLTFLYFLGIGLCYWLPGRRNPFGEEPAAA
ncbi:MAG: twin-arginine translocase subunit TatC [Mariniblastus sp.]|nr:twin-arginine translocase subunit TatC [Mariniblastus sp.]